MCCTSSLVLCWKQTRLKFIELWIYIFIYCIDWNAFQVIFQFSLFKSVSILYTYLYEKCHLKLQFKFKLIRYIYKSHFNFKWNQSMWNSTSVQCENVCVQRMVMVPRDWMLLMTNAQCIAILAFADCDELNMDIIQHPTHKSPSLFSIACLLALSNTHSRTQHHSNTTEHSCFSSQLTNCVATGPGFSIQNASASEAFIHTERESETARDREKFWFVLFDWLLHQILPNCFQFFCMIILMRWCVLLA